MLDVIINEFPTEKTSYYLNIDKKNYSIASENVHKLKHKISILGLVKSYEVAIDHENNLKKCDTSLNKAFDDILNAITNYLIKL